MGQKLTFWSKMTNLDQKYYFFTRPAHFFHFQTIFFWCEQPLAPPAEDVVTGLEFLVDLPMWSLVGQRDWRKT